MRQHFVDIHTRLNSCRGISIFSSSSYSSSINHLKQIHANLIRNGGISDILTAGKLIGDIAVSNPSNLDYARSVFTRLEYPPSTFMWNSMIRGYAHSPTPEHSITWYRQMLQKGFSPNNYTFPFVFKACTQLMDFNLGLGFHGTLVKLGFEDRDAFIHTSLVNFYASCGSVETARLLFERFPERDVTSWNALIKGYVKSNQYMDAIRVFRAMQGRRDVMADEITLLGVVLACTQLGALDMGRWVHAYIGKNYLKLSTSLGTALVDMYARCGRIDVSLEVFDEMPERDVRSWSVMIGGLSIHGLAMEALELFSDMCKAKIAPDSVTFTGILRACSHAGMVVEGLDFLDRMVSVYNVEPTIEHYGCIVDLLGRAGRLEEAFGLIRNIPLEPDVVLWGALLVACRAHKNIEMGEIAAQEMLKLDPFHCGAHVFLSNIYASSGKWDQVEQVRNLMKEHGIRKPPGSSLIEVDGDVHEFIAGDRSHPQASRIRMMMDEICRLLCLEGHVSAIRGIPYEIEEEEKEHALYQHSEKLAVAFGLINTKHGSELRIVKNLRVCEDCHSAMKLISKIFGRRIIIRDRARFHHFKDGSCSCRDYW